MNNLFDFEHIIKLLPQLNDLSKNSLDIPAKSYIIFAEGFEDRVKGFIQKISTHEGGKIIGACIINYLPKKEKNLKYRIEIKESLGRLKISESDILNITFNREFPADFANELINLREILTQVEYVYCDISSMSKLLIMYIVTELFYRKQPFSIVYTEALNYGPEKEELKTAIEDDISYISQPESLPPGVFAPIIPPEFSGISPLNVNRVLVAFLSLNKRQLIGVTKMIPYQALIPIVGKSIREELSWIEEEKIKINNEGFLTTEKRISDLPRLQLNEYSSFQYNKGEYAISISTTDYRESVAVLLGISTKHRYQHFLTIAPFGTKLQTVGVAFFLLIHPEAQIAYAMPTDYLPNYSEGIKNIYEIKFNKTDEIINNIQKIVDPNLDILNALSFTE